MSNRLGNTWQSECEVLRLAVKFFSPQPKGRTAKLQIGLLFHSCRIADLLNGLFDEDVADQRVTAHVWFPRRFSSPHA